MSFGGSNTSVLKALDSEEIQALVQLDMDKNALDQALLKVKHLLQTDKGNPDVLSLGGRVYAQLRLFEKAKNCFKQFLEIDKDSITENFQYGMVHFDSGERDQALAIWNDLLASHPTFPPALFFKGLLLAQNEQVADARSTLSILLQSAPADNLYFGKAKELLQAMDQGDRESNAKLKDQKSLPKDAYNVVN